MNKSDELQSVIKKFGYTPEEAANLTGRLSRYQQTPSFGSYSDHLASDPSRFLEIRKIFSADAPFIRDLKQFNPEDAQDYRSFARDFLATPVIFENFALWSMFMMLDGASFEMASDLSISKRSEPDLTGILIGEIHGRTRATMPDLEKILGRLGQSLCLQNLDLQIDGREPATGGDTAIFVEWTNLRGSVEIIPIILQSKRYPVDAVEIDQKNSAGTYQFHVLEEKRCPTAYICFQNSFSERLIPAPLPPLVKAVKDIPWVGKPVSTSARKDTLPLSAYIFKLLQEAPQQNRHPEAASAIGEVLQNVEPSHLNNLAVFSVEPNAALRFQEAWDAALKSRNDLGKTLRVG